MSSKFKEIFIGFLVCLAFVGAASAHHSPNAVFDTATEITVSGVMTRVGWVNPHVYFEFEATDENGNKTLWRAETHGPTFFRRNGINKAYFDSKMGLEVAVIASPSLNGTPFVFLKRADFSDGTALDLYDSADTNY